jgi:hypothetical protein
MEWLAPAAYEPTRHGLTGFQKLGIDIEATRSRRRLFVGPCLDWSERKPHLAGSLGAAFLDMTIARKWLTQELDSRALELTTLGRREFRSRFAIQF